MTAGCQRKDKWVNIAVRTPANDPVFAFCLLGNTRNIAERNHLNSKASDYSRVAHHPLRRTSSDFSPPPVKSASNENSLPLMSLYEKLPVAASLCSDLLALSVSLLLLAKQLFWLHNKPEMQSYSWSANTHLRYVLLLASGFVILKLESTHEF
jgi:hypothetical protein